MKVVAIVLGVAVAFAIVVVTLVLAAVRREHNKRPVVEPCGEAGSAAGGTNPVGEMSADGDRPRDGGVAPAFTSAVPPSDSRPSVPAHEKLLNYRPAPENRDWCNDFALAGALEAWSREVSS